MSTDTFRQVVCGTGLLISLEKITSGYRFIGRLYDRLLVPSAVMDELVAGQFETKDAYLRHFDAENLVVVESVLKAGSAEAVEKKKRVARELGLQISGIAGQLLKAAREEMIYVDEALDKLKELRRAGRINRHIFEAVGTAIENEI